MKGLAEQVCPNLHADKKCSKVKIENWLNLLCFKVPDLFLYSISKRQRLCFFF